MMFITVIIHELKNMTRDKMYKFFLVYPIIMAVIVYFLVPYLKETAGDLAAHILILMFILLNGFVFGAITGFTLLDDQDDNVLFSLKITPISVKTYIISKLGFSYLIGFVASLVLILVTGFLKDSSFITLLMITVLATMQAPIYALLINCFAKNKVEGFVIMKLSGIILLVPIVALFINNWTELFLSVIPGFWVSRLVSIQLIPGEPFLKSSYLYFALGMIINIILVVLLFKIYARRVRI
ncbi:MAG: ABC transporter permease [Acholeplasmataceae bacterium]|nr:ABC transporter permease [Acholeplasmataceae bacterium]